MTGDPRDGGTSSSAGQPPAPEPPSTLLVHFYRAVVAHADVWRMRMDATTNWAAATTAGMITFAFSIGSPHFVLLLALAFDAVFLLMEARRYQTYHLWHRRFHALNRYLVAPALAEHARPGPDVLRTQFEDLALDLGRTVPHIQLREAIGYRIHRNYGFLFGIVLVAWVLKLGVHPAPADSVQALVRHAAIGALPGAAVWLLVAAFLLGAAVLAIRAPGEGMIDWTPRPAPWGRWRRRGSGGGT